MTINHTHWSRERGENFDTVREGQTRVNIKSKYIEWKFEYTVTNNSIAMEMNCDRQCITLNYPSINSHTHSGVISNNNSFGQKQPEKVNKQKCRQ